MHRLCHCALVQVVRERNTPQAFSPFSFVASRHELMVVDIQGVQDFYTDPQIHSRDGERFGQGNLGPYGIERFLESHRCNGICQWLKLKPFGSQQTKEGGTAAPSRMMPHKHVQVSDIGGRSHSYTDSETVREVAPELQQPLLPIPEDHTATRDWLGGSGMQPRSSPYKQNDRDTPPNENESDKLLSPQKTGDEAKPAGLCACCTVS
jgi:hypothetical protein